MSVSDFDLDYRSNRSAFFMMKSYLDTLNLAKIDSVVIVGSTSPEGAKDFNTSLAFKRAQSLKDIFVAGGKLPSGMIKAAASTDTWSSVIAMIEDDPNFPNKSQTLALLYQAPLADRMWLLKKLDYEQEYRYLIDVIFTQLRNAATILIYKRGNDGRAEVLSEILARAGEDPAQAATKKPDSLALAAVEPRPGEFMSSPALPLSPDEPREIAKTQKPLFALKTNLLYDAATLINVSLEVPLGRHWSVAGEFIFPWWLDQKRQNALQVYNGNLEVKYWFRPGENPKRGKFSTMTGWFLGVYGGGAVYDIEYRGKGYQGESLFSTGLMGGYAHSIGKSLRLEYSLGVGYVQTHYIGYDAKHSAGDNQWSLYRRESAIVRWVGPTHAKISLVWMLCGNAKKGGTK